MQTEPEPEQPEAVLLQLATSDPRDAAWLGRANAALA
eukprot:SAG11_NODE_4809_length_1759_cov_2.496386_1_plen_36_part_10